jgi:hydroxyethylthiazole kinase
MMFKECLENVRKSVPLVHNITNYVTVNDVANVILACGGSPIMADDPDDATEITAICGGLNINIGTLNKRTIESMHAAGKKARELGHPILLDPVGAGASHLRTDTAVSLMDELHFDVIRGNVSELKAVMMGSETTKGVDADAADAVTDANLDQMVGLVKKWSAVSGSIIAMTGAIDLVADKDRCFVIRNGRKEMSSITGTGCQLSGLMTAYIVANPDKKLEAAAAATCLMGYAGEVGWSHMQSFEGNSTYRNRIIDAIYQMDGDALEAGAKYEIR